LTVAIIPLAEEAAVSTGMLSWLAKGIGIAAPLADLVFGAGHHEPARNDSIGPMARWLQAPAAVMNDMFGRIATFTETTYTTLAAMRARMDRQFDIATRYSATLYKWATARAHAETLNLARSTNVLISSTKVYADTVSTRAAARSTAQLSSDAAAAVAPEYQGIRSDLEAAAAVFGVGQPAITGLIKQLPAVMPAGLPGAEAVTGKALRVLTKTMEDCVAPNCRDTSKFGKDLQSLFGLVEGAAFLAFLAFIIKDPDDAVRETFDTLDGLTHTIIDGARNLVGF